MQLDMKRAKAFANDKHLDPWAEMLKAAGITASPLTPYISEELLQDDHLSVDGSAIEKTGFAYTCPDVR
jgi:hypothetical protein